MGRIFKDFYGSNGSFKQGISLDINEANHIKYKSLHCVNVWSDQLPFFKNTLLKK